MAKLSKAELAKREDIIQSMKKNKRSLVKRYGPDAEKVMYGRATNIAKKVAESEMENINLKELVRTALMNEKAGFSKEYDNDPALKGGQKNLPDGLQKAIIDKSTNEDLDLGHTDNEPHMLKGDLYRIGKYAMELYQMVDEFEGKGEVDFPHWWQAKIINAREAIESAKHYLDFETKEPQIDAMVDAIDMSGALDNIGVEDEIEENLEETRVNPNTNDRVSYLAHTLEYIWSMGKGNNSIDFKDLAKSIVGDMFGDDEDEIEEGLPKGYWSKKIEGGIDEIQTDMFATRASKADSGKETYFKFLRAFAKSAGKSEEELRKMSYNDLEKEFGQKLARKHGLKKINVADKARELVDKGVIQVDESYEALVKKLKGQGKSEKAAKAIAGAVASYKAKGGGKGPTAKQKARG